jgi:DMSO/TMAO reductase YedYZ molybdopterin-dependent catalytic subunit
VRSVRSAWSLAGLVAGLAGVAVSYAVAMAMTIRESPVVAVAELVVRVTPGAAAEGAIGVLGTWDKPLLVLVILVLLAAVFAWAGRLAARSWWAPVAVYLALAATGVVAVSLQPSASPLAFLPLTLGFVTWLVVLSLLAEPLHRLDPAAGAADEGVPDAIAIATRRGFLLRAGGIAAVAVVVSGVGRVVGAGRRHVEETRRLLRLPGVTEPVLPRGVRVDVPGITPWETPNDDFYQVHTAIVVPSIEPRNWRLRIHGLVDRPTEIGFDELLAREHTEAWVTLNCVSNRVGGDLIGNAWWSGVRVSDLLTEAGIQPGADAVLQTSDDGWTCGTPLTALMDGRDALLAVAMNGEPLPIEHGFPVRTVVPGLYGYVSACKWVVDLEVTRFDAIDAYWVEKGWAEQAPVKISSRVDVPRSGSDVPGGAPVVFGGVAWEQHTGIEGVEIAVDGGAWQPCELASVPNVDTWVQWTGSLDLQPGDHTVRVRATSRSGQVQTGVEQDVLPDGATGWHSVDFTVSEPDG